MPKHVACPHAGVRDQSSLFCQQLLEVELGSLPEDAEQLQTLLKSGQVPVTQVGSCLGDCSV